MIELFRERLEAVDAHLWIVDEPAALAGLVRERAGSGSVVAWEEASSLANAAGHVPEDVRTHAAAADVSLIVADVGIAETGQIGFAHNASRPREVALLPDRQIVLLHRHDLVLSVKDALLRLRGNPHFVLVAGPSRTADIEQRMMLGVHAPRSLDVIVYG